MLFCSGGRDHRHTTMHIHRHNSPVASSSYPWYLSTPRSDARATWMVPRFKSMAVRHTRRQHRVAHGWYRAHCGSIAWHMDSASLQVNGCTHSDSIACHMDGVPRAKAMAAHTAAASRGTWMVPHFKAMAAHHTQRQHRVAHGWCLASNQWLPATVDGRIAWHMDEPPFKSLAARTAAASRGTWMVLRFESMAARHARGQHRVAHGWCLASNRVHIQQQHRVAHGWCLASNQWLHTTHGGSIAWHMDGASLRINGYTARTAAASRGTRRVPRCESMAARHTRRQHARRQHHVAHGRCLAPNQ